MGKNIFPCFLLDGNKNCCYFLLDRNDKKGRSAKKIFTFLRQFPIRRKSGILLFPIRRKKGLAFFGVASYKAEIEEQKNVFCFLYNNLEETISNRLRP